MSYGTPEWQGWVLDEEKSLPLLEHAYRVGLNTWDTVRDLSTTITIRILSQLLTWYQGRRLLQWQIRRDHRQSLTEIQYPPSESGHPVQMLFRYPHSPSPLILPWC